MDSVYAAFAPIREILHNLAHNPSIQWKPLVFWFTWVVWAFESWLLIRQYPNYSKTKPPAILKEHFTDEKFQKSQVYGRDKARFSLFSLLYRQIVESLMIHYDVYAWTWGAAGNFIARFGYGPEYEIPHSIAFVIILVAASLVPGIPLSVYQTFVLEEKHGFNKTTPTVFVTDLLKSWALGFVFGVPFFAGFLSIVRWAGDRFVPWLMAFFISFQVIMVIIYPTIIQPLFNKLSPLREGELRDRIEALASGLKFPLTHLYEIDGSKRSAHSNAYFFGLPWSKHIVIYDTLIKQSTPEEVEAVLAHELGHWYYQHPSQLMLVSNLHTFILLSIFTVFTHSPPLLLSFGFPPALANATRPPTIIPFILFQMISAPLESVMSILMNWVSRRFEWQADRFACEIKDKIVNPNQSLEKADDMGERLGRALIKLHVENLSTVYVDWLFSAYHHSHPTLTERLEALAAYQKKKESSANARVKKEL